MEHTKRIEQRIHSEAGMVSVLHEGGHVVKSNAALKIVNAGYLRKGRHYTVHAPARNSSQPNIDFLRPGDDCDDFRERLLPYAVPSSCRIEVLADMKRVATDCRRNFGAAPDPVSAIFAALLALCPDATAAELRAVLDAAELELHAKLGRLGWDYERVGVTSEIESWRELAKGRIYDLGWARGNIDQVVAQQKA